MIFRFSTTLPHLSCQFADLFAALLERNSGLWDDALEELIYSIGRGLVVRTAAGSDASAALLSVLEVEQAKPYKSDPEGEFLLNPTPEAAENFSDLAWAVGDDAAWSRLLVRVANKAIPCSELVVYGADFEIARSMTRAPRNQNVPLSPLPNPARFEIVNFATHPFSQEQYRNTRSVLRQSAPHATPNALKGAIGQIVDAARQCDWALESDATHKQLRRRNRVGDLLRQWRPGHPIPRECLAMIRLGASLAGIERPLHALSLEEIKQAKAAVLAEPRLKERGGGQTKWALAQYIRRLRNIYETLTGKRLGYSEIHSKHSESRTDGPGVRFAQAALAPFESVSGGTFAKRLQRQWTSVAAEQ